MINWNAIPSPLISCPDYSLKDPSLVWHDGWFYLYCSAFYADNWSKVIGYRSRDLVAFEKLPCEWGEEGDGWCSPDMIKDGDRWIMTLQSWDGVPPRESRNQVFYRTSSDLHEWSEPMPLAGNLTVGHRAIDAAMARHKDRWYVVYKESQTPRLAMATELDGPWEMLDDPFSVWAENYQFLRIDGQWHVVATLLDHAQGIAAMKGSGDKPGDWSSWADFQEFTTPVIPGFNSGKASNASCLLDHRSVDGWWYRAFCSTQVEPRGNLDYSLGIARSQDLVSWQIAGA